MIKVISSYIASREINNFLRLIGSCLSLIPWIIVLLSSNRGLDITDEASYLMNFKFPLDIKASFSFFGIASKPLYWLARGNITAVRIIGILIWMFVSGITSWFTINFISRRQAFSQSLLKNPQVRFFSILLSFSAASLYYTLWLLTPSYNWLVVVFLTVFILGLQFWLDEERPVWLSEIGLVLLAYSAGIIFWSRAPSTFPLLILFITIVALMKKEWNRLLSTRAIIVGVISFLLSICLPIFYGLSFNDIVTTLSQGSMSRRLLWPEEYDGIATIFISAAKRILKIITDNVYIRNYTLLWTVPFVAIAFLQRINKIKLINYLLYLWLLSSIVFISVFTSIKMKNWSFTVFSLIFIFFLCANFIPNIHIKIRVIKLIEVIIISILCFSLSIIFAYSTNNSYGSHIELAAYYIFMSITLLMSSLSNSRFNLTVFYSTAFLLFVFIALLIYKNSLTPYRQPISVWKMNQSIEVNGSKDKLLVSKETQRYINELRALAGSTLQSGTPLIDMTGHSPGAAFLLGGRAPVNPWLWGGYPGSDISAEYVLGLWSDSDLKSAWILTAESNGIRSINLSILEKVGLNFPSSYELTGTVRRPASDEIQGLWRPQNSE